jgi:hypothetical protein
MEFNRKLDTFFKTLVLYAHFALFTHNPLNLHKIKRKIGKFGWAFLGEFCLFSRKGSPGWISKRND